MNLAGAHATAAGGVRSEPVTPAALRRVLATLCVTETVSWGVLYYAFPVMAGAISEATGWSMMSLTAAFSAGLVVAAVVGIPVGHWLDRHGPRGIMTAGSLLAAVAVVFIALAPNPTTFAAGWLVAGVAMAAVLYPPAFAALTRWFGEDRVRALTLLTLAAGLASTIFAPLTAFLLERLGWRAAYFALAAILVVVTVPGHWWGLRGRWPAPEPRVMKPAYIGRHWGRHGGRDAGRDWGGDRTVRSLPFLALALALGSASFTAYAVVINLVPLLIERGMETGTAALALGAGGAGQVLGRLTYPALTRHTSVRARTSLVLFATAVTTGLLGLLTSTSLVIIAAIAAGVARGLLTLVHATAVTDRWGTSRYGRLTGLLSAPITATVAVAPWGGAAIASLLGDYSTAFLVLAGLGMASVLFAAASVPRPASARTE